jgi:hypothetical protein
MSAAPSPRPRPRPNAVTSKSPAERLTGVEDKPAAPVRKRGRERIVEFLGRKWQRFDDTIPSVGWEFSHECLATPDLLEQLRKQHELEDAKQVTE